jgi:hypothetical protein
MNEEFPNFPNFPEEEIKELIKRALPTDDEILLIKNLHEEVFEKKITNEQLHCIVEWFKKAKLDSAIVHMVHCSGLALSWENDDVVLRLHPDVIKDMDREEVDNLLNDL